jgi:hypothetical protein
MNNCIRIALKGDRFTVARLCADHHIPFAFVRSAGPNTVGDISATHVPAMHDMLDQHPELEGRFTRTINRR